MYDTVIAGKLEIITDIVAACQKISDRWHGSGVNGNWYIRHNDRMTKILFTNDYQIMNEHGSYVGWCGFAFHIPIVRNWREEWSVKSFQATSTDRARFNKIQLKEFLEDTFATELVLIEEE